MQANTNRNRRADFETDETIARLQKLVKEYNVEAANEYIRKLLMEKEKNNKTEQERSNVEVANEYILKLLKEREGKDEKEQERVNNLQKATAICFEFENIRIEENFEAVGLAGAGDAEQRNKRIEKLFEQLYTIRPIVHLYVQEAVEKNDASLVPMLAINERLNMWINYNKAKSDKANFDKTNSDTLRKGDKGSKEECADLLGGTILDDELFTTPPSTSSTTGQPSVEIPKLPPPPTFKQPEFDVSFIGFSRNITPQLERQTVKSTIVAEIKSPMQELTDLNALFDTSPPNKFPQPFKPTLNQLINNCGEKNLSNPIGWLENYVLSTRDPIIAIDKMNIRVLFYRTVPKINETSTIRQVSTTFILSVANCGTQTVEDVNISVKSNSLGNRMYLEKRGVDKFSLPGFSLQNVAPPKLLELRCVGYKESEIDVHVNLSFKLQVEQTITSNITVFLK